MKPISKYGAGQSYSNMDSQSSLQQRAAPAQEANWYVLDNKEGVVSD